jgi:hypothetical protein
MMTISSELATIKIMQTMKAGITAILQIAHRVPQLQKAIMTAIAQEYKSSIRIMNE